MDRAAKLRRSARRWRVLGTIAFLIGVFLIWERVSYNLHDFYAENYSRPTQSEFLSYAIQGNTRQLLDSALAKMEAGEYWQAITSLERVKQSGAKRIQIAEWYKILCMIGLEEKEEALSLLEYYTEQSDFTWKQTEAKQLLKAY